jgi:hypothetical protein
MDKPNLTKTCSSCGLQKPRAAFLQLGGSAGTIYGHICADCRQAKLDQTAPPQEPDEQTASTSGKKIDSKSKVHDEIIEKKQFQDAEALDKHERQEIEEEKFKQLQKVIHREEDEKKHRKSFLEKGTFLTTQKTDSQRAFEARIKAEQDLKMDAVKQEAELKGIDLALGPYTPSQTGAQIKYQGSIFAQFKAWLGMSAPLVRSLHPEAQTLEQKNIKIGKEAGDKTKTSDKIKISEQSFEEDIQNTFRRPPSGRRSP